MMSYQIDPFVVEIPDLLSKIKAKLALISGEANRFARHSDDPADSTLEQGVGDRAAHNISAGSARDLTVNQAAETVKAAIRTFDGLRMEMGNKQPIASNLAVSGFDSILIRYTGMRISQVLKPAKDTTPLTIGEWVQEDEKLDPAIKRFIGQICWEIYLAGRVADAGNAFVNLYTSRRSVIQRYAEGEALKDGEQLLNPEQAIFSKASYIKLENLAQWFPGKLGIPAFPAGIGSGSVFTKIREGRQKVSPANQPRHGDDILDLADQLTEANETAKQYLEIVASVQRAITT
jgi:hypothetical protein